MRIIRWAILELLQASPSPVNLRRHLVARNSKVEVDHWVFSVQVMVVVVRVVARTELYSQWRIWGWQLENMESMSRGANFIDKGVSTCRLGLGGINLGIGSAAFLKLYGVKERH
jgi:hypothetical protein